MVIGNSDQKSKDYEELKRKLRPGHSDYPAMIKYNHFNDFTIKGTDFPVATFRPVLVGPTNWPAVLDALEATGYRGYVTFEYFHPYLHYPEALVYQTSDSLDRMLGKKA